MKYTKEEMLSKVDHTLLKPEATWPQIQTLCDEAIANHCASVCINTCYVKQAAQYMAGRVPVCCVVGFPSALWTPPVRPLRPKLPLRTARPRSIWSSTSAG